MKKLNEGWEYDDELAKKLADLGLMPRRGLNDGTPIDSYYRIRELIVMRIPKEMAESRNKFYTDKANRAFTETKRSLSKNIDEVPGGKAGVYGNITEEKEFRRI
jgi:hypothetical protein